MILGIDEVGRGPWAGPLVVGAVVLGGVVIDGLTDSKKLTKKRREILYNEIINKAASSGTGWVSAYELDEIGMSQALVLATKRAVEKINVPYSEIVIDGTVNFLADTGKGKYVQTMAKADLLVPTVSAASIMAKVERDRFMSKQDEVYPGYGFSSHAGYGVAKHREAIEKLGVTPLHRLSFAPLKKYQSTTLLSSSQISLKTSHQPPSAASLSHGLNTKSIGDKAENVVADYLSGRGHQILDRNWRTRICEIDIVSRHDETIYFTEVKYRKTADYGDGFAAITSQKLSQMKFAAEYYALKYHVKVGMRLAVASVSGEQFVLEGWLELI